MNHYHEPVKPESAARALVLVCAAAWPVLVPAAPRLAAEQPPVMQPPAAPAATSTMDALLFYQLLIGEMELQSGRPGVAVDVLLDAARRTRDEQLYQRAVEVALQARAGDKAAAAARAWRTGMPDSVMALRYQVQILAALGKAQDAAEPVRSLLARTTATERLSVMASLPRLFVRGAEGKAAAEMIEQALQAYSGPSSPQREAALVSAGRAWLLAGDDLRALGLAQQAAQADPRAPGPVLLALELMPRQAAAETMVQGRLQADDAEPALRLAYVRSLTQQQRLGEAVTQLQKVTQQQPDVAGPWLTLGAVELELKHAQAAEKALLRYLALAGERPEDTAHANASDVGDPRIQARLMLAQAAELRNDFAAAERYLLQIEDPQRAADVQARRASLLVRQGKWREARALMQRLPDGTPAQARAKALGEAQILREAKQWREAYAVLGSAVERFGDDADLVYEQAMVAEKMDRLDEMERLLRRVIALKPDHQHAYNALGYSLADRGLRLPEARELIEKALALAPGDPFITDSLGWLEFRTGRHDEALRLLRQAYKSRPDTEIAAHLGEVLWTIGLRDEARRVWSEGRQRDAENEVLRETLSRLKPGL